MLESANNQFNLFAKRIKNLIFFGVGSAGLIHYFKYYLIYNHNHLIDTFDLKTFKKISQTLPLITDKISLWSERIIYRLDKLVPT